MIYNKHIKILFILIILVGIFGIQNVNATLDKNNHINKLFELSNTYYIEDEKTLNSTEDAEISMKDPTINYGRLDYMDVRNRYGIDHDPDYWEQDILVKFNLSEFPSRTLIKKAILGLYYYDWIDNNPAGRVLKCHKITSNWSEKTVTWNTRPIYSHSISDISIIPNSEGEWILFNVTSDVNMMVNSKENNGWQINDEIPWNNEKIPITRFTTKENKSYIPFIFIKYEVQHNPPLIPIKPIGNNLIEFGENTIFLTNTTDPDGDLIKYGWDFNNDNHIDKWTNYFLSGETIIINNSWNKTGFYGIKVLAEDYYGYQSNFSDILDVIVTHKPEKPIISGLNSGKAGVKYNYSMFSNDEDKDKISFYIEWGDNTYTEWTDNIPSGEILNVSHMWEQKGTYIIKAKARDIHGAESEWANLEVSMPIIKKDYNIIFRKFLDNIIHILRKRGIIIVSGIIEERKGVVMEKMKTVGFEILDSLTKEHWVVITGRLNRKDSNSR